MVTLSPIILISHKTHTVSILSASHQHWSSTNCCISAFWCSKSLKWILYIFNRDLSWWWWNCCHDKGVNWHKNQVCWYHFKLGPRRHWYRSVSFTLFVFFRPTVQEDGGDIIFKVGVVSMAFMSKYQYHYII